MVRCWLASYRPSSDPTASLIPEDSELWTQLDRMKDDMSLEMDEENAAVTVVAGTTMTFTADFVSWVLRSGSLLASFLSSVPLFKQFDPLPILNTQSKRSTTDDGEEEDSDENRQARAVERLFED